MNLLHETILSVIPPRHRISPYEGATKITFNCPVCHTRNHTRDTRMRGAFFLGMDGSAGYDCFQCQLRTRQNPHQSLSRGMREILRALGLSDGALVKLSFDLAAAKYLSENRPRAILPDGLRSIDQWIAQDCTDGRLLAIASFLQDGPQAKDLREWYWTADDNGMGLSGYAVAIHGSEADPVGWWGYPVVDKSLPVQTHNGPDIDDEEPEIPQAALDEGRAAVFADDEDEESK